METIRWGVLAPGRIAHPFVGDLALVTGGRYRHVRVDDKTLDIEVRAPEKHDWVKVSALS